MLVSCSGKENAFPIPSFDNASGEESLELWEGKRYQLSFTLEKKYPNFDALDFYEDYYEGKGFIAICRKHRLWSSIDATYSKVANQIMISDSNKEMISIYIFYSHKEGSGADEKKLSERQGVIVSLVRLEEDYDKTIDLLRDICLK